MDLEKIGWDPAFQPENQAPGSVLGRIGVEHRGAYTVFTEDGNITASIPGRMRHDAARGELPAVGDWVLMDPLDGVSKAVINSILPRRSRFSRKVAGETTEEQVVAANVDTVFIVTALNQDQNLRRVERYLALAWESGALPVVVLTKADLCDDVLGAIAEFATVAPGVDIHAVSVVTDVGVDELTTYLKGNKTIALLGSSGVGKSTLVNRLAGSNMKVKSIRSDGKGKHTTTHREMIIVPEGGVIIDTPGMREVQLWDADEGLDNTFADITAFAADCRFNDCAHEGEPGCAVAAALASGVLTAERLESHRKLERELAFLERRQSKRLQHEEARKYKKLNADARARTRNR
ncbi:MAG: ribosome small subunit-dependent GTPase A [Actinomycetota bacterium]